MNAQRIISSKLVAIGFVIASGPVLASDPVGHLPDVGPCGETSPPAAKAEPRRPISMLEQFVDLDRIVRAGCPPRPLARAYRDVRARLAPFDRERIGAVNWSDEAPLDSESQAPGSPPPKERTEWWSLGPTNISGRTNALAVDPRDPSLVYAAAAGGGIWKTVDTGASWMPISDSLPSIAAGALLVDPANPDTLWFGTGEGPAIISIFLPGAGIFRSTDRGVSWRPSGLSFVTSFFDIERIPSQPSALLAATDDGIFRSIDEGATWDRVLEGSATSLALGVGSTVYAALGWVYGSEENGFYRSTDAGATFSRFSAGLPAGVSSGRIALASSPADRSVVWAGVQDATSARLFALLGLYKSTDSGSSWSKIQGAPDYCSYPPPYDAYRQCFYNNVLLAHPTRVNTLFLGGIQIYRTMDGGSSFRALTSTGLLSVHVDQHAFAFSQDGSLWAGNDGGIYRSTDNGTTWEQRSNGYVTTQFYAMAASPDPNLLLGGLQDNGSLRFNGNENTWKMVLAGDGGPSAIDPVDSRILYAQSWLLNLSKSTNGGASWKSATTGIPDAERNDPRTEFISPIALDVSHPSVLYAGTWRVWRSTDAAATWMPHSGELAQGASDGVSVIAVAEDGSGETWAGTTNGRIYRNSEGTFEGWSERTTGSLPRGHYLETIAIDPSERSRIWLGFATADDENVYRTTDGGTTWSNATGNLPRTPVSSLVVDPENSSRVFAGTDLGVFVTTDDGASWRRFGHGFPVTRVEELLIHRETRRLRAATHGRGIFETHLGSPTTRKE